MIFFFLTLIDAPYGYYRCTLSGTINVADFFFISSLDCPRFARNDSIATFVADMIFYDSFFSFPFFAVEIATPTARDDTGRGHILIQFLFVYIFYCTVGKSVVD